MEFVTKYSDVFLAALVVSVVGLMIIPLPTWLIDVMLTLNIAFGITILLAVVYITHAIRLAAFPSILLLATLFRLGLNVSTTRLILLNGDAGSMVHAFGSFVVRGNVIVGAIIFSILTLINFIVISKGSERVAEVSARFTLDAMPGKQMAIDADLRAGAFDLEEATSRRRMLSRESQLFGAMDGAMKFVKGDAIAGILITLVNILGGVSVGILMKGMSGLQALQHFGILTIGDGLLSQVPALILSAAAGLMVTRVEPETTGDNMGRDISMQLLSHPKALGVMACILMAMGIVPGLPFLPFMTIAALAGALSVWLHRFGGQTALSVSRAASEQSDSSGDTGESCFSVPIPITLNLSRYLTTELNLDDPENRLLTECLPRIRRELYMELGVRIPSIRVRGFIDGVPEDQFSVSVYEIPVYHGIFPLRKAFVTGMDERISLLAGRCETVDETHPCPGTMIESHAVSRIEKAGYDVYEGARYLAFVLKLVLRKHASEFIGLQEVKWLCDDLEKYYPDTVNEVLPGTLSYPRLCDILKRLVQEGVSIRDLKSILESLAGDGEETADIIETMDRIRTRLNRQIFHDYSHQGRLNVFLLDPQLEDAFKSAIRIIGADRMLMMEPDAMQRIFQSVNRFFSRYESHVPPVILTVEQSIRYVLWRFLSQQISGVRVMAAQELPPGAHFTALDTITLCA